MNSFSRPAFRFRTRDKELRLGARTKVMGILNVTPDSFSDGGLFQERAKAAEQALKMVEDGADLLDVGGESSRPGAQAVSEETELNRVLPVVEEIRGSSDIPISVDTCKASVARAAIEAGADIVNDISALSFDSEMRHVVSRNRVGLILMHMRGTPRTMQKLPASIEIMGEIRKGLEQAIGLARAAGVANDRIMIDPGIGFGKTVQDNLKILNQLSLLHELGFPLLTGASRKSFIGNILGTGVLDRVFGTAASVAASVMRGAHIVRVHDVREMRQVVDVVDAILNERN